MSELPNFEDTNNDRDVETDSLDKEKLNTPIENDSLENIPRSNEAIDIDSLDKECTSNADIQSDSLDGKMEVDSLNEGGEIDSLDTNIKKDEPYKPRVNANSNINQSNDSKADLDKADVKKEDISPQIQCDDGYCFDKFDRFFSAFDFFQDQTKSRKDKTKPEQGGYPKKKIPFISHTITRKERKKCSYLEQYKKKCSKKLKKVMKDTVSKSAEGTNSPASDMCSVASKQSGVSYTSERDTKGRGDVIVGDLSDEEQYYYDAIQRYELCPSSHSNVGYRDGYHGNVNNAPSCHSNASCNHPNSNVRCYRGNVNTLRCHSNTSYNQKKGNHCGGSQSNVRCYQGNENNAPSCHSNTSYNQKKGKDLTGEKVPNSQSTSMKSVQMLYMKQTRGVGDVGTEKFRDKNSPKVRKKAHSVQNSAVRRIPAQINSSQKSMTIHRKLASKVASQNSRSTYPTIRQSVNKQSNNSRTPIQTTIGNVASEKSTAELSHKSTSIYRPQIQNKAKQKSVSVHHPTAQNITSQKLIQINYPPSNVSSQETHSNLNVPSGLIQSSTVNKHSAHQTQQTKSKPSGISIQKSEKALTNAAPKDSVIKRDQKEDSSRGSKGKVEQESQVEIAQLEKHDQGCTTYLLSEKATQSEEIFSASDHPKPGEPKRPATTNDNVRCNTSSTSFRRTMSKAPRKNYVEIYHQKRNARIPVALPKAVKPKTAEVMGAKEKTAVSVVKKERDAKTPHTEDGPSKAGGEGSKVAVKPVKRYHLKKKVSNVDGGSQKTDDKRPMTIEEDQEDLQLKLLEEKKQQLQKQLETMKSKPRSANVDTYH
ncbi:protein PF14_0175-like isoform X2 [Diaphorina citri]|uniref:Protein PF14_0175-like isoform X2 n=1 Tax=Diaphorina citri TaxID=121845 RepID=A0A1S3D979_DIACI|nr:protein PF14_0175-like isoform X2 [Diaphorina citri]